MDATPAAASSAKVPENPWKLQEANLRLQMTRDRDNASQEMAELRVALDQQAKALREAENERDKVGIESAPP